MERTPAQMVAAGVTYLAVATDGFLNSYPDDKGCEHMVKGLWESSEPMESTLSVITAGGSGDDISVAMIEI